MAMEKIVSGLMIVIAAVLVFKLFSLPIRLLFRILISTAAGFVLLVVFNYIGLRFGLALGINIVNALVIGVLGLPGLIVLIFVKQILGS